MQKQETEAEFHCRLAKECQDKIGYVLDSIIKQAGIDAISCKKIDVGYLYRFTDGSALEYNVLKNTITLVMKK